MTPLRGHDDRGPHAGAGPCRRHRAGPPRRGREDRRAHALRRRSLPARGCCTRSSSAATSRARGSALSTPRRRPRSTALSDIYPAADVPQQHLVDRRSRSDRGERRDDVARHRAGRRLSSVTTASRWPWSPRRRSTPRCRPRRDRGRLRAARRRCSILRRRSTPTRRRFTRRQPARQLGARGGRRRLGARTADAAVRSTHVYRTQFVDHAYLETEAGVGVA